MKCKNCGAELNNGYCEYCGSFYGEELKSVEITYHNIFEKYGFRDANGRIQPIKSKMVMDVKCTDANGNERRFYEA